jgi:hypothetical protein
MMPVEIYEAVKAGGDAGWNLVREHVVAAEMKSLRSGELARKYCITEDDLVGMLYEEMIGKGKIALFRNDGGSLWGWMRQYVHGYVMRAKPNRHGEFSIEGVADRNESGEAMVLPDSDTGVESAEIWRMTHRCLKDLWNEGPRKAYVLYLRTRMHLSSAEVANMLDLTEANVDQIFSRSVKQMRANWVKHEKSR